METTKSVVRMVEKTDSIKIPLSPPLTPPLSPCLTTPDDSGSLCLMQQQYPWMKPGRVFRCPRINSASRSTVKGQPFNTLSGESYTIPIINYFFGVDTSKWTMLKHWGF